MNDISQNENQELKEFSENGIDFFNKSARSKDVDNQAQDCP